MSTNERRKDDQRIHELVGKVEEMQTTLAEIKDIMAAMRVIFKVLKWITAIAAAAAAVFSAIKGGWDLSHHK